MDLKNNLKSVSGLVFFVKDMKKTAEFYGKLGFRIDKNEPEHLSLRLNWYWMDFHPQDMPGTPEFQQESNLSNKGAGLFVYISVADVDEYYKGLVAAGIQPDSEPQDYPWGNREFLLRDPDGYKLVIFKRK